MGKDKGKQGEKNSFVLYGSYAEILKHLTREEKGILLEAIFAHEAGDELPDMPRGVAIAFEPIRFHLELDRERYEEISRENSRKARLRWERADSKRKPRREPPCGDPEEEIGAQASLPAEGTGMPETDTAAFSALPSDAERCLNDNDNENDDGNVDENGDDDANENERPCRADGAIGSASSRDTRQKPAPAAALPREKVCDRFEEFWERYPHKVYRDRARTAWLCFIGEDGQRAEAALTALSRAVREDHRFLSGHIPYPSNWLRNDRPWEAGYAPPPDPVKRRAYRAEEEQSSSFDTEEFFQRALERTYGRVHASASGKP